MHLVWTLAGSDALTPVSELVAALESSNPDQAIAALSGRDVDSGGWLTTHPRGDGLGPATLTELWSIRTALEHAHGNLQQLRFTLASALYCGEPAGARRVVNLDER
jgi:hypothetical protein